VQAWPASSLLLVVLGAAACGGDEELGYLGTAGQPVAADFSALVPEVAVRVGDDGGERAFLCDSGSQLTFVDTTSFPALAPGKQRLDLFAFALEFPGYPGAAFDAFGDDDRVAGLIGGDLLRHFAFTMDYAGDRVWLSDPYDPSAQAVDAGDEIRLPMTVRGGGRGFIPGCRDDCSLGLPATRIVVRASFEDLARPIWAVIDSGASTVVMSEELMAALALDEARPILSGVRVATPEGERAAVLTRVWRVDLGGGAAVDDVPVMRVPGWGALEAISAEVGLPVSALIGGSLLRHFLTTLDYQRGELRLRRYHLPPVPAGEFVGPALSFARLNQDWFLREVYPEHDAFAKGLRPGDLIEELDGMPLFGQPGEVIDAALARFQLGDLVPLRWRRGTQTGAVEVLVEDFLPSYPAP
jgi:hypothetical protein